MAAMCGFIHENPGAKPLSALIHELKVIVICVKSWVPDPYLGFCVKYVPSFLFAEHQACWEFFLNECSASITPNNVCAAHILIIQRSVCWTHSIQCSGSGSV